MLLYRSAASEGVTSGARDGEGDSLCVDVEDRGRVWRHSSNSSNSTVSYHHTFLEQYVRHAPHWRPAHCEAVVVLDPEEDSYTLLGDGSLEHLGYGVTPHYCVDTVLQPDTGLPQEIVLRCQSGGQLQVRWSSSTLILIVMNTNVKISAANRLIGEVVQSQRRPLLGPSPG